MRWHASCERIGTSDFNLNQHYIMKNTLIKSALLALVVGAGSAYAQDRGPSESPDGNRVRDRIHVPADAELPTDVQELVNQFRAGRDSLLAQRREVLQSLGEGASEEEIRAALGELRESSREALRAQRDLARQLRKELRQLRRDRTGDGTGNGG
jgi:hypothetical protein